MARRRWPDGPHKRASHASGCLYAEAALLAGLMLWACLSWLARLL
ncbi:MAG: hypothetical protein R3E11_02790 [Sphingobium sp.]